MLIKQDHLHKLQIVENHILRTIQLELRDGDTGRVVEAGETGRVWETGQVGDAVGKGATLRTIHLGPYT